MTLVREYQPTFVLGDGETKEFPYLFEEVSENFIKVIVKHSDDSTYVPVFSVDLDSHKVVFGESETAPLDTDLVCIYRETPDLQDTPFRTLQGYDAKALENILSKIVAMIQELKANGFSTQILQGTPWQLDLLHPADDGASVVVDYNARILKKGLYFQIVSGNLQVSADGSSFITMPKSADITEFRCLETVLEDLTVVRTLQYKVNGVWYDAEYNAQATADEALSLAQTVQGDLSSHKLNHNNPHETSLGNLTDVDFTNLQTNQFLKFNGTKWVNVNSSTVASWGNIIGNITDQTDLMNKFSEYVKTDGTSVMTAPLKFRAGSMRGAVGPYLNGISFWKLDSQGNITNIANLTDSQFLPVTTNAIDLGRSANAWKNLYLAGKAYMSVINNGYDIAVPVTNSSDTLALKSEVDLAANSGRMILDQGVWYAKMYAATVAPAAEDGTNYADFSQTDNDGNPIIVIYERQSGAWVQSETITPPAEYDGYVPITSKIWDIVEQAGQQGGRILWNHQSKDFTPYPQIISYENIEITGNSTVIMPATPTDNNIPNKKYVDDKFASQTYHPDLFDWKLADHKVNDVQWLRADTFSWQDGSVYEAAYDHLEADITGKTLTSETVAGVTVQFYLADDGHKICPDTEESNVASIYTATGVAWYYILDTVNQRFKLPRAKHNKYTETLGVVGNGLVLGLTNGTNTAGTTFNSNTTSINPNRDSYGLAVSSSGTQTGNGLSGRIGVTPDSTKSGLVTTSMAQDTDQHKYLYFYVGNFTQSAIENTAGLNAELFNDKVDVGHEVIEFQAPTAQNNYTWYRKYADGWVEQGGHYTHNNVEGTVTTTLAVTMADTHYNLQITKELGTDAAANTNYQFISSYVNNSKTTTTFQVRMTAANRLNGYDWQVSGMSAS